VEIITTTETSTPSEGEVIPITNGEVIIIPSPEVVITTITGEDIREGTFITRGGGWFIWDSILGKKSDPPSC
jgi:hypothetical protein